jgi:hypothetical protein
MISLSTAEASGLAERPFSGVVGGVDLQERVPEVEG